MSHPTGESLQHDLRVHFDRRIKLAFHGAKITSDGGLLAYRELDDALGLTDLAGEMLHDSRTGRNGRHGLMALLRQSVFGRLAGYEDVNDADRLSRDPAMRFVVGGIATDNQAASASQMGRFETELLASDINASSLAALNGRWIDRARNNNSRTVILDMDSSVSPTYGHQEGTAYNGHFSCMCYHPLFVFNQHGDLENCALRPGNVHSADGWEDVLSPVIERYRGQEGVRRYFRGDAAFASPALYEFLEEEGYSYAIRLKANAVLQERVAHLLARPVGRPPHFVRRDYASFSYQAQSWSMPRRVVCKVEWHPDELYPRVGFIVTNMNRSATDIVHFYNQRATAEQYIKEGKNAIQWTRLSCRSFRNNEIRLWLHTLAYNLANFMRTLVLPKDVQHWSLTTLREKLVKIGAKIVRHGRYVTFQLAEVAVPGTLFAKILARISNLRRRQGILCAT